MRGTIQNLAALICILWFEYRAEASRIVDAEERASQNRKDVHDQNQQQDNVRHRFHACKQAAYNNSKLFDALDKSQQPHQAQHPKCTDCSTP